MKKKSKLLIISGLTAQLIAMAAISPAARADDEQQYANEQLKDCRLLAKMASDYYDETIDEVKQRDAELSKPMLEAQAADLKGIQQSIEARPDVVAELQKYLARAKAVSDIRTLDPMRREALFSGKVLTRLNEIVNSSRKGQPVPDTDSSRYKTGGELFTGTPLDNFAPSQNDFHGTSADIEAYGQSVRITACEIIRQDARTTNLRACGALEAGLDASGKIVFKTYEPKLHRRQLMGLDITDGIDREKIITGLLPYECQRSDFKTLFSADPVPAVSEQQAPKENAAPVAQPEETPVKKKKKKRL